MEASRASTSWTLAGAVFATLALCACFGASDNGAAGASAGGNGGAGAGSAGASGQAGSGSTTGGAGGSAGQVSTAGASGGASGAGGGGGGTSGISRSDGISDQDVATYCMHCGPDEGCGFPAPGAAHPECVACPAVQCARVTCSDGETMEIPPDECCPVCVVPGSPVANCDEVGTCVAGADCAGVDCCDAEHNYFDCNCGGIDGCILLLHCPVNEPYGCAQVSQGAQFDPANPPPTVCGCQVECGTQGRIANAAGGTWPNGSLKGFFTCSSEPPP